MTIRIDACQQLIGVLDEQIAAASRLFEVLAEEKRALAGFDRRLLGEIDVRKRSQLSLTEQLEQKRRQLCRRSGIGLERGAMDYLVNDLAAAGYVHLQATLRTRWQRLCRLVEQCRDANEVNGLIANFKHRQVLHLLNLLRSGGYAGLSYDLQQATVTITAASATAQA